VPDAHYLVCGSGEELARLTALAEKLGVADAVSFGGRIPQGDLCRLYNLAELFVMPNRTLSDGVTEGFGIVFLEAGACALPVVGGDHGGVPDAIRHGETGYLVNGNDVAGIADAVTGILTDPALARRMGTAGRAFAEAHDYPSLVAQLTAFLN